MSDRISESRMWPAGLDAMVAAPDHHTVLFENDQVRVLDAYMGSGETVPVHTHCWPGVLYILGDSDFVRRDPDGNVLLDTRLSPAHTPPGSSVWGAPLPPHSLENVGGAELRDITVELRSAI